MKDLKRRDFLKLCGLSGTLGIVDCKQRSEDFLSCEDEEVQKTVNFSGDGLQLTPSEYLSLLVRLEKSGKIKVDSYSQGGVVQEMEQKFAEWLGKESAIFFPTGTLANHIAIKKLAGNNRRVIVQTESHVYNDEGDCFQALSGLNLIPLGPDRATFTLDEVQNVLKRTLSGRVETHVGVISIESPVRRKYQEMFDYDEMKKIATLARSREIRMHLDGARLFLASAHTGIAPDEFAVHFDTVYISLYKCFNAASGAVLAGSFEFIKDLFHMRRMFGGGMHQAWPFAAVALHYLDSFLPDYGKAMHNAEKFFNYIQTSDSFRVEKFPNGTNTFKLHVKGIDPVKFRERLRQKNVILSKPRKDWSGFIVKINGTLNRIPAKELSVIFAKAL